MSVMKNNENFSIDDFVISTKKCIPSFLSLNCDKKTLIDNYNYILTEKAKDRLDKLYTYISYGIPVLLEGETGTSKTLSAEIICKHIFDMSERKNSKNKKEEYIKYNLSADVKINDLMQKFIGDNNFFSGLEIIDGPFLKAFKEGIPLILDEINLASEEVLQCIEEALDSGEINMEISGIGHVSCKKGEGFCLIATQNPNSDNYLNKRQYLSKSFLSHFQIIKFPSFEINELEEIANQMFKSFNNSKEGDEKDKKFISDLIKFHKEWTTKEERKAEIACFTIREIVATVKAYIDEGKKNPFKIVKVIYASRYPSSIKKELLKLLEKFDSFKKELKEYEKNGSKYEIPTEIKGIYKNKILNETLESALFSLEKKRNIIIVGDYGIGKSYISRNVAKIFNKKNEKNENNYYHFICTEDTKCSDLIGYQVPKKEKNILHWEDGFLTKAIEEGNIVILDNLQEANSTVTERLNGLLDIKYDEDKKKGTVKKFDIPENPLKASIEINKDFRIIGVCDIHSISQMSPAFLNRFDIIFLEDQLNNISNNDLINLLNIIFNRDNELSALDQNYELNYSHEFDENNKREESFNINEILNEDITNYLANKIKKSLRQNEAERSENIIKYLSFSDIARLCISIKKLINNHCEFDSIPKKNLIDFIYELLFSEKDIKIKDEKIKEVFLKLINQKFAQYQSRQNHKKINFFFSGNESIQNFLSIVYASFLINLHLCIIGPPGIGKTTSAMFISEIFQDGENNYKFFPFHRETKISDLYGTFNIEERENVNGPLIESAMKGFIFIADEMNLSSISTMKSIVPFLDPYLNKNILISGINKNNNKNSYYKKTSGLDIRENFFFIVCQNDLDNLGRNIVPDILQRKLRNIAYPKQTINEIKDICKNKRNYEYGTNNNNDLFSEEESELLGVFMKEYNDIIDKYKLPLLKWSFRDIDKIIKRIHEHNGDINYKNFKFFHFIYFYLLSPIPKDYFDKLYNNKTLKDILHSLFIEVFHQEQISDELKQNYFEMPKPDFDNNYLMKGNIGVKFDNLIEMIQEDLSDYYNDLFKLKLISSEEPVLLMGPSSYKTELATYFIKNVNYKKYNIINLNQKTTIEELLGGLYILPRNSFLFFYDLLKNIMNFKEDDGKSLTEGLKDLLNEIKKYSNKVIKHKILKNLRQTMVNNIKNIQDPNSEENKNKDLDFQLVFKPGSILLSILKEESIIFKNINEISTEIFERFNELFGTERILTLNEDIYGTFFDNKNQVLSKSINLKMLDNIYIFATCSENSFQTISESIISRFSVINVGEHGIKAKEKILKNYSKKSLFMTDNSFMKIQQQFHKENFRNIKKLKNLINIFNEMNKNNINNGKELEKIYKNLNYAMHYIKLNNKYHLYNISPLLINNESPLFYEKGYLVSKITNLKIKSQQNKKEYNNIIFTREFNEMADLIHFGICTGTPIILEGSPGQGKQKVINYICDLLDFDIENIIITDNFSVDELFKNRVIQSNEDKTLKIEYLETKLNKFLSKSTSKFRNKLHRNELKLQKENKINNENNIANKHTLFIFHNIQKANADVLSKISEIFNNKSVECNYSFIGIINIKESFIDRSSYYYSYFYNSIYYIINSTAINITFYEQMHRQIFKNDEIKKMQFAKLNYFNEKENSEESVFTLSDFIKFILLKKISDFDNSFLEEIIFKNKYDSLKSAINNNNVLENKIFDVDINYKNQNKELLIEVNGKSITLNSKHKLETFESEKNTLSFEQKKCLIVLGLSVKSKLPFILKGQTGIGKSHLIKLFSKMLGQKLYVIEFNKDNDISILTKRNTFKKFDSNEIKDIEAKINEFLENKKDINNLNLKDKIKKLNNSDLGDKKANFEELKEKYHFIHRFQYENSNFLNAVLNGEWVLLDGIENAPSSIIEKLSLLCGEKPELNLFEIGQEPIIPKDGFHLFMTYNPDRINHNDPIPSILLDKCLIYNLESFIDNKNAISQIIYGFLVNSNYSTDIDFLSNISSKLSNIHFKISKELGNENEKINEINERTFINFCKNLKLLKKSEISIDSFPLTIKNNFLYFYFPSNDKTKYNQIINNIINEQGNNFLPLANNFSIKCKGPLDLLKLIKKNIKQNQIFEFNIGDFIFCCLDIPFEYLNNLKEEINKFIVDLEAENDNNKINYLPLKYFLNLLNLLNISFNKNENDINKNLLREVIDFEIVKILLLFEGLYKKQLLSWDCIDILYQNTNIFQSILNLIKEQNIFNLGIFFDEIISKENLKYIGDILNIFPYSNFINTKFSLLNDILLIVIKNSSIKKINFKIKIVEKEYYFKFNEKDNETIKILLDLNLNNEKELIITKETQVIVFFENKNKTIPVLKTDDSSTINKFFLLLIEQIINTPKFVRGTVKNILKGILFKLDDKIQFENNQINFNFDMLFKKENNLIINIWSILFSKDEKISQILFILKGLEKEICQIFLDIKNSLIYVQNFHEQLNYIMSLSIELSYIIKKNSFLFNLSHDENYVEKMKLKTISEQKKIQRDIKVEINAINSIITNYNMFPTLIEKFLEYSQLLEETKLEISNEIDKLEFIDFKQRVTNKINNGFSSESLKRNLLRELEFKKQYKEIMEFDSFIDNYLSKYKRQNDEKKIRIFSEKDDIDVILKEEDLNENEKTIEILLLYSEIRDLINDYFSNKKDKLISLQKLNERIDINYVDFFNCFLLGENNNNPINKEIIYGFLDSILVQEIISKNLVNNFIELKNLLNNLYDIKNYGKINEIWCKYIEKQYNLSRNIYFPNLSAISLINLFIRIKNDSMVKEKGFLIESKEENNYDISDLEFLNKIFNIFKNLYDDLITTKDIEKLIAKIAKLLLKFIIQEENHNFDKIIESMNYYLDLNKNNEKKSAQFLILKNFLKVKELYLKYEREKNLLFDDLNNTENNNNLFTLKYPSLLNYLNCNPNIYAVIKYEPEIFNYHVSNDRIPLWLICLRTFANTNNIKPFFDFYDDIIIKFEEEFKERILEKLKSQYKDIYWIILISNNKNKFLVNQYYERLYRFFTFLLYELTLLSSESKNKFYILIKDFIFNIFDDAYEKGVNFILTTKIELFNLNDNFLNYIEEYSEQKFQNFYNSKAMKILKDILEASIKDNKDSMIVLIDKLKDDTKKFEKQYAIENSQRKAEIEFSNVEDLCKKYNLYIDNCINNIKTKEEIDYLRELKNNDIKNLLANKDAIIINGNYSISENESFQKVECLQKDKFIEKHIKRYKNEKFEYFNKINLGQIKEEFKPIFEGLKKAKEMIFSLDKNNISNLKKLNSLIKLIEEKEELLHKNNEFDKDLVEQISFKNNIDINVLINKISELLKNINEYIQIILDDFNIYEEDNDIYYLKYINKYSNIIIPEEKKLKSILNNNNEYIIINDKKNIIPYITIRNDKIIGFDKLSYDFGILNLNYLELQYIYFAVLDENIKLDILKKGNDIEIIKRNKLFIFQVKIKEKKTETLENICTKGTFQLNYNGKKKIIDYDISYQLEAMKIYLKCDKYKLNYIDKLLFQLNSEILFQNEEIYFTIKNLTRDSENNKTNIKVILKTFDDNNCLMPIKTINNKGFSLLIKSGEKNGGKNGNDILSCSVTVIICQRFQFEIRINCIVKPFDFEFLISQNKKKGFLNEQIYCSFEDQDEFEFILYISIQNNRICEVNFENEYNKDLIQISDIKNKDIFFNSKQINIHVKLLKKTETNIKLKATIDKIVKEINIIFTSDKEVKNSGYKYPNNFSINDESEFFCFSFNELSAHGMKRKDKQILILNNNKNKNIGYKNIDQINNIENLKIKEIDTHIDININGICEFFNRMSEEARILPIYCLNCENEKEKSSSKNKKIIKKNFHILEELYFSLIPEEEIKYTFYEENYFYEEIKEFIKSFEYLNSIINIKDKDLDEKINKIKNYMQENKHKNKNFKLFQWFYEKILGFNNTRKLKEYIKKNNINIDDFDFDDSNIKNKSQKNENMNSIKSNNNDNNNDINLENININNTNINNANINHRNKINNEALTEIKNEINKNKYQLENQTEINNENIIEKNKEKISQKELFYKDDKSTDLTKKINSIIESAKKEEENKNNMNKILQNMKNQNSAFMKQDIWKQNANNNSVKAESKITQNNNIENMLENKIQKKTNLSKTNTQLNSLQDIKREMKTTKTNSNNIQDNTNLHQQEIKWPNLEKGLKIINIRKDVYIPDKDLLNDKRHEFESRLEINDDNNSLNESKEIIQMVKNKEMQVFTDSQRKENFIEKTFRHNKKNKINFQISFENNDAYFNEFDEELVNDIVSNIQEKENEDKSYQIEIGSPIIPKNRNKKNDNKDYIIKELVTFSKIFMEQFLETISRTNITFEKTSFCFIIDCSLYLGIKVKLFNLMIILSIIKILYMIDIKFSILLSADDKYKIIIKNYNENFEYEDLIEILYETMIIKRYRNNILKSIMTSIQYLKKENGNTIFLVFSDCMDESFTYPNYWLKNILVNETNNFIIITEKSRLYKEKNKEIIDKMINSFEENINKNTLSKIKIIKIDFSDSNIYSKIKLLFSDILQFLNDLNETSSQKEDVFLSIKNEKNIKIFNEEDSLNLITKNISHFESLYKDDIYKKYDKIFFINNEKKKSKMKLLESFNKKENIIIPKYINNNSSEKNFLYLFQNYSLDRTLIDSIFYPNKATQKQLSTKGTEIDIEALILYTLKPVEEPKIYLENKGGLIRNYSITVIIDNSKSCFDDLNERHSFQTIINLFHIINSMAIPSFDLILTTKEEYQPNILLFDKPSVSIFKNETVFEELLKYLSNPVFNTDLSAALKIVYELKKMRRNDRDSYLFILTDGLCHKKNEQKIIYFSNLCQNLGIKIFGVGIGIFPYKAQNLFDTFIYAANPAHLLKAISKIFGKMIKTENELNLISDTKIFGNLENIFNTIRKKCTR